MFDIERQSTNGTVQSLSIFDRTSRRTQLEDQLSQGKVKHDTDGKIVIRGHIIDIRDCMVKIGGGVEFVKDWVGQAAKASPEASVAWSVVCLGLQMFTKTAQVEEMNSDGLAYVSSRMQLYIALEQLLYPVNVPPASTAAREEVRLSLIELYERILEFQIRSIVRFRKGHWYQDIYGKDDWQAMRDRIELLESNIRTDSLLISNHESSMQLQMLLKNANDAQMEMMDISRQQLKHLQNMDANLTKQTDFQSQKLKLAQKQEVEQQEEKESKCMEALRLDQRYDESKELISPLVEGTCHWFLDQLDYKNWLYNSGCLLVSADPGCGKSVLAKHILENELPHKDARRIVCYFFFRDQIQNTFAMALSALLHQLLQKAQDMFKYLLPLYKSDGAKMIGNSAGLSEALLKMLSDPKIQPVTFILDALDECKGNDVEKLLEWIARINKLENSATRHKFLLTSRPYQEIVTQFGRMKGSLYVHIPGNDKSKEISEEVNLVIRYRCQKLYEDGRIYEDARDKLLSKLLAQPHNTYLFVYLVFKELEKQGHYKQTKKELERRLRDLPDSVDQAYENILNRNTKGDPLSRDKVVRLLSVMLSAHRPLKVEEIQCAVKLDFQDYPSYHEDLDLEDAFDFRNKLRDWCGLFVQIDNEDQVTFLHQTAREFLLPKVGEKIGSAQALEMWAHSITLVEAHALLATICITYLSLKDFDQSGELNLSEKHDKKTEVIASAVAGETAQEQSPQDRIDELYRQHWAEEPWRVDMSERYPFLRYAAREWNYHFIEGHCDKSSETVDGALALYNENTGHFSTWAKISEILPIWEFPHLPEHFQQPRPFTLAASISQPIFRRLAGIHQFHLDNQLDEAALMTAIRKGQGDNAILLLEHGVNPNCQVRYGNTALSECVYSSLKSVAAYLLEHGARIDANALCAASSQRDMYFLVAFLKHDVEINAANFSGYNPLYNAAQNNSIEAVDLLLEHGADLNLRSVKGGFTALHVAEGYNHLDLAQKLLHYGIDINRPSEQGCTALLLAANSGHLDGVRLLLQNRAEVDAADDDDDTALTCAARNGHYEVVELLLEYHADVNRQTKQGSTALLLAAWDGYLNIVRLLLEKHAEVDTVDHDGFTALSCAARNGHSAVVETLLEHHAGVNKGIQKGTTALHSAAWDGYDKLVETLLNHGAEVDIQNKHGCTVLLESAYNGHLSIVEMLLQHKADPNIVDDDGDIAITSAALNGHYKIVQLLLQHNAAFTHTNFTGYNALHSAAVGKTSEGEEDAREEQSSEAETEDYIKTMQLLIEAGLDINVANSDGTTPLMRAVSRLRGHRRVLEYLIENGANIDAQDKDGRTCMHYVYSNDALQVLVERGLDVNRRDFLGRTPLLQVMLHPKGIRNLDRFISLYHAMVKHGADPAIKDNVGLSPPTCLDGGFSATSREISLDGKANLTATCSKKSGGTKQNTINLDTCLKIEDGRLTWAHEGNFSTSVGETKLIHEGRVLQAEVLDNSGVWRQAYIWLDEKIANNEGDLKVVGLA